MLPQEHINMYFILAALRARLRKQDRKFFQFNKIILIPFQKYSLSQT